MLSIVGRVAQSVLRLATGWTVRGSNPGGGNLLYLCDIGIFHSVWVAVWSAPIHTEKYQCRIDKVLLMMGTVARNMYRS